MCKNTPYQIYCYPDDVIKWKHFPRNRPFVRGIHPAQRPVTRSFAIFFDLRLNKRLNKQSWGWWFQTLSRPLRRHRNVMICIFDNHPKGLLKVGLIPLHSTCSKSSTTANSIPLENSVQNIRRYNLHQNIDKELVLLFAPLACACQRQFVTRKMF